MIIDFFSALLVLLSLGGYGQTIQKYRKLNFGFAITLGVIFITLLLYSIGLVSDNLHPSIRIIYWLGLAFFVYFAFWDRQYFSVEYFIFFTILLALYSRYHGSFFSYCDDFTHWGLAVKEIFLKDRLISAEQATAVSFVTYPPATAIFQYFIARNIGAYAEGNIIFAHAILTLLPLVVLISLVDVKLTKKQEVVLKLTIGLFYLLFFVLVLDVSLQVENLLGALFGILLVYSATNGNQKPLNFFAFILPLTIFISLVKATSALYLIYFIFFSFYLVKVDGKRLIVTIILCYVAYKLGQYSWRQHISGLFYPVWREVDIILAIKLLVAANEVTSEIVINFVRNIGSFLISGAMRFSLLNIMILYFLLKRKRIKLELLSKLGYFFIAIFSISAFSLLVSYLTIFSEKEAIENASYFRYMQPTAIGFFIVTTAFLVMHMNQTKIGQFIKNYLILVCVVLMSAPIIAFTKNTPYKELFFKRNLGRDIVKKEAEFIASYKEKKLGIIFLENRLEECVKFIYELAPIKRNQILCVSADFTKATIDDFIKDKEYLYIPRPISYDWSSSKITIIKDERK